ncbi:glycoside hydrolase family 127 protein [Halococcus sp. IIIV-5B]|nr:glycoside hydrolase family 127 protein [Halococcus sp. IIIV-5B]
MEDVEVDDEFWSPWIVQNREVTLRHQYDQLEESGTLENFRRAAASKERGFRGMWFQDSDAYKWLEAASFELAKGENQDLKRRVDEVVDLVAAAQEPDGYLNTYFQLVEPDQKWTNFHMMHELYCGGHLIEAAAAHYQATGENDLLNVATAFADHTDDVFGDEVDAVPGHEEIELALIKLYHVTDEERYLNRAEYFVELRGHNDRLKWEFDNLEEIASSEFDIEVDHWEDSMIDLARRLWLEDGEYEGSYAQAHAPIADQTAIEGHSVRAMYLYSAVTDLVAERGNKDLRKALDRLWENMTTKRMYITGGIGPAHANEGFTEDYDLPNDTAYNETCAAIGSIFWNQRMLELTEESKYADLIERTLYNGFLAGVAMDGQRFFYVNPLESDGDHHRKGWFTCACCPPNAARLFASLGQYIYSKTDSELYVNQYIGSSIATEIDGTTIKLAQSSSLPWDEKVTIDINTDEPIPINFRIPNWCANATILIDGKEVEHNDQGFVRIDRDWDGNQIEINLEQRVKLSTAHPEVESNIGRAVVERGPLVYCAEATDNDRPLDQYSIRSKITGRSDHKDELLNGITTLEVDAVVPTLSEWESELYRPVEGTNGEEQELGLVPYYAWDNRDPGSMRVWHRYDRF